MTIQDSDVKVSIICLAYNHEKYIKKCLDGFVSQKTGFLYEAIIHDDASLDKTANIIQEYELKYPDIIRPIYERENQYSKNVDFLKEKVIPNIRGDFVAFCEGDDFWNSPYKLQKQYDAMINNLDCGICVSKVKCVCEDGLTPYGLEFPPSIQPFLESRVFSQDEIADMLLNKKNTYPFHTSSYFIRRDVLEKYNPGNWNVLKPRDYELLKTALAYGSFYFINEHLSTYRINSKGSWSEKMANEDNSRILLARLDAINDLKFNNFMNGEYSDYVNKTAFKTLYNSIETNPLETIEIFKKYNLTYAKYGKDRNVKARIRAFILLRMYKYCPWLINWYLYTYESKIINK